MLQKALGCLFVFGIAPVGIGGLWTKGIGQKREKILNLYLAGFLSEPCCQPFADGCHYRHVYGDDDRFGAFENYSQIDEHAYTYEKIGYEQGVAYKFEAVHQGGNVGDKTVQNNACEKCSQDGFQPDNLRHIRCQEDKGQDKYELRDIIIVGLEKPSGEPGINV